MAPPTPQQRRARNRREMEESILAAARAVMRERGVAALTLNEVARRVGLRPQSLAEYVPSKAALYEALVERAIAVFAAGDERAYREHPPGWGQIEAWIAHRLALAEANPDLHQLGVEASAPDFRATEAVAAQGRAMRDGVRRMVAAAIAAGELAPGMPEDRAADVLLAMRHGVVAEILGKRPYLPPGSDRHAALAADALATLRRAWSPSGGPSAGEGAGD